MPYVTRWVPPRVLLTHGGVTVYRTYKNDQVNNRLTFWFTLESDGDEGDHFDVRELPNWVDTVGESTTEAMAILTTMRDAIDQKLGVFADE